MHKIIEWLKNVYGDKSAVVGVSGGVDSAVALTLLSRALGPDRVIPVTMPYGKQDMKDAKLAIEFNKLIYKAIDKDISEMVDLISAQLAVDCEQRRGNVMARVRMITLFDIAKANNALVCGTENKSENELGYYTRFGDAASDVEPIAHLYKTEVWELARELALPEIFVTKAPSAGLWEGQSDEGEMGFSYVQADKVLKGETQGMDPRIVELVRARVEANKFKSKVPYMFPQVDVSAI